MEMVLSVSVEQEGRHARPKLFMDRDGTWRDPISSSKRRDCPMAWASLDRFVQGA